VHLRALALALLCAAPTLATPIEPLLSAHGWGHPSRLPALDRVAAQLTTRLAQGADQATATAHLTFLLAHEGIADAIVTPFTVRHQTPEQLQQTLPGLLPRLSRQQPPTHFGFHQQTSGAQTITAAVLIHRGITFAPPLPRSATPGTVLKLTGTLRRGYYRPRIIVAPPNQPIRERPAWTTQRQAQINLYLDAGPGVYGVEVLANSQHGPVALANQRLYVGVPPPPRPVVHLRPTGGGLHTLRALLDVHRQHQRLPALRPHAGLQAIAQAHANELAGGATLDHASPNTGTLATRLRAAHVPAWLSAENLAHAPDAHAAWRAFLDSPGHARNLVLPQLTHLGLARAGQHWVLAMAAIAP
jgi:hypothetical protein